MTRLYEFIGKRVPSWPTWMFPHGLGPDRPRQTSAFGPVNLQARMIRMPPRCVRNPRLRFSTIRFAVAHKPSLPTREGALPRTLQIAAQRPETPLQSLWQGTII